MATMKYCCDKKKKIIMQPNQKTKLTKEHKSVGGSTGFQMIS